jgi:protein required for attachment to host cells
VSAREHALERWLNAQLRSLLAARRSEGMLLVAGPRLLAQLRTRLLARVEALPRVELARDLVKHPAAVLEKRAQSALLELQRAVARKRPGAARASRTTRRTAARRVGRRNRKAAL